MTAYLKSACERTCKHSLDDSCESTDEDPATVLREPLKPIIDDEAAIERIPTLVTDLAYAHSLALERLYFNDVAKKFMGKLFDLARVDSMFWGKFR